VSKGNYGVNWGNTDHGQGVASSRFPVALHLASPFGYNATGTGPALVSVASVTDGTSNTVLMGELLQGSNGDVRGTVWLSHPGGGTFTSRFTPNGYADYVPRIAPWNANAAYIEAGNNMDNLPTFGGDRAGQSPPEPGSLCDSQPAQGLICWSQSSDGNCFSGTRSRHPGGVNTLMGDGSVRFMKNTINPLTWIQVCSMSGGDVVRPTRIDPGPGHGRAPSMRRLRPSSSIAFVTFRGKGLCAVPVPPFSER